MKNVLELKKSLSKFANKNKSKILANFFKTNKGQYGYGDIFIGVSVPITRKIVKRFCNKFSLKEVKELLKSKIHEERLAGVLILVWKYKNEQNKKEIYDFYIKNFNRINNWDLVDTSAPNIVGDYLFDKDKKILKKFAESDNLWKKRIAIISTLYFIKKGYIEETIKISKILLNDSHDLIHKAVGWMLRESWKVNNKKVEEFLKNNYNNLPRTTLRYSIEKMKESVRKKWLLGKF